MVWGRVLNSRTAERPSLDSRHWNSLTACFAGWSIGVETVAIRWMCWTRRSDKKNFRLCKRWTWQLVNLGKGGWKILVSMQDKGMKRQATWLEVTYKHWFSQRPYYNVVWNLSWNLSKSSWRGTIPVDTITAFAGGVCLPSGYAAIYILFWSEGPIRMKPSVGGTYQSERIMMNNALLTQACLVQQLCPFRQYCL